jgi:RHS repeat-associated protein
LYDENGKMLAGSHSQAAAYFAHIPLPGGAIAGYGNGTLTEYKHGDWLGSVRFSSTPTRGLNYDVAFAPFGEPYAPPRAGNIFAGMEQIVAADEYETPNREYNTTQGRWITPDPAGLAAVDPSNPQTWNLYTYGVDNPLRYTDPTGMSHMDANSFWVGDSNGECEQQNGGTVCWNAKANEWQAPPPPQKMDNGAVSPGMLGPGDLILFSGVRTPSFVSEFIGKALGSVFGKGAESGIQKLGLEGAAEAANAAETQGLVTQAASTVGNQGVKASSKAIAEQAAKDWVGPGARDIVDRQTGQVVGKISSDGTKIARFTSVNKPQPYVNLVNKTTGGNLHVSF